MKPFRSFLLFGALLLSAGGPAQAQNFFERLFGLAPARPVPPPAAFPAPPPPDAPSQSDEPRRSAPAPVQARPVSIRAPNDDSVIGRELKANGTNGSLRIDRTARGDLRARLTLIGRRSPQSVETCAVAIGGPEGAPLVSQGKPEGLARYQLPDPTCPMQLDILDEAVLVKGPSDVCVFQTANCQADPGGLWGPEPSQLVQRARDFESARGAADKAVRENYKVLVQRARPEAVRPIVAEQAAFSADRETICRSYAREGSHSFCNARVSEARAISLATRLGITVTASTQPNEGRPRRRQVSDTNSSLPSIDDLLQRSPDD